MFCVINYATHQWYYTQIVKAISYYHNMQYQVTTMYQTGENRVCPKAARACPNPGRLDILRTNFFLDLKFSEMLSHIIFYLFWSFQQNLMIFSWDMGRKSHLGPNLAKCFFFRISGFVTLNRQGWKFEFFNPRNSWAKRGGTQVQCGVGINQAKRGRKTEGGFWGSFLRF